MSKIYIFRSGTVDTQEKIFLGWKNVSLSSIGINEAKAVSKTLNKINFDYAFCSDQLRGKQALLEVVKNKKNVKIIIDPRLREKNYGIFTGMSKELVKNYLPNKFVEIKKGRDSVVQEGENMRLVGARVFSFLNDIFNLISKEDKNILICTHTNPMRLMQEFFEDLEYYKTSNLEHDPKKVLVYEVKFGK